MKLLLERFPRALGPGFSASRLPSTSNIFKRVMERPAAALELKA
jgi:hypothetical protein